MTRFKEKYQKEIIPAMMKKFSFKNKFEVPKIEKIILNCGFGKQVVDKTSQERKTIESAVVNALSLISGQKPILTKARKSISSFKLRQGMEIGAKVILRRDRMYDFLEKLILLYLPRTRDFRGIPLKNVDKSGNLTIGFKEFSIAPEISLEKEKFNLGFEVTIALKAKKREEAIELLKLFGFPFQK
ncbi:MAG: 50S ribosomal protein L5 [Minisyncoccia bacterium]